MGVVLCGGESRRMGRDKGLLQTDGQPWVLRMGEKLATNQLPVVYSINKKQVAAYATWLPPGQYVVDSDIGAGPLKGLLSVHRSYPDSDLLPVACDMQDRGYHRRVDVGLAQRRRRLLCVRGRRLSPAFLRHLRRGSPYPRRSRVEPASTVAHRHTPPLAGPDRSIPQLQYLTVKPTPARVSGTRWSHRPA